MVVLLGLMILNDFFFTEHPPTNPHHNHHQNQNDNEPYSVCVCVETDFFLVAKRLKMTEKNRNKTDIESEANKKKCLSKQIEMEK